MSEKCSSCGTMDDHHMRTCYFIIRKQLEIAREGLDKIILHRTDGACQATTIAKKYKTKMEAVR